MTEKILLLASMGGVMAAATVVAALLFKTLEGSGEEAMVKMRLHSEETFQEFNALKWAHLIQTVGLFILGIGALVRFDLGITIGRLFTLIQGTITIAVMSRWWRRFR